MVVLRIPLAGFRIPKPWIPDSTDQNYLDSGLPYMGRTENACLNTRSTFDDAQEKEKQAFSVMFYS